METPSEVIREAAAAAAIASEHPTASADETVRLANETVERSAGQAAASLAAVRDAAAEAAATMGETVQTKVKSNMDTVIKTAEDFVSFGQGNLEALMRSGQIWVAGVQDMSTRFAATAQAQFDATVSTFKALTGVRSLKEAVDLQSGLARSSMETAVAETSKLTDATLKLTEQTLAPLTARVSLAVEKFGRTV